MARLSEIYGNRLEGTEIAPTNKKDPLRGPLILAVGGVDDYLTSKGVLLGKLPSKGKSFLKFVQLVSLKRHHFSALGNEFRSTICAIQRAAFSVRELRFEAVRVNVESFHLQGAGHGAAAVWAHVFVGVAQATKCCAHRVFAHGALAGGQT